MLLSHVYDTLQDQNNTCHLVNWVWRHIERFCVGATVEGFSDVSDVVIEGFSDIIIEEVSDIIVEELDVIIEELVTS